MAPKYLLPCSCGQEFAVEASQAGQQARCSCGAVLEIPTMRGLSQLERADPDSMSAPSDANRGSLPSSASKAPTPGRTSGPRRAIWGTRQKLVFIGGTIAVTGLVMVAVFFYLRPRLLPVEDLAPFKTWQLWHDLRHGIDQRPPWEQYYLDTLASNRRWTIVACTIAAFGVLTMAGSLLVSGRRSRRPARRSSKGRRRRVVRRGRTGSD